MFYTYHQNKSFGRFVENEDVAHYVIIEAKNSGEANRIANSVGLYFNGCADGRDCPCCGDRWYPADDNDGDEVPSVYGKPVTEGIEFNPSVIVYYKDGRKETFRFEVE